MSNKARDYTQNTAKRLYGLSGNVCANPECRKRLIDENGNQLGEIAHICAASPDGPRYNPSMTDDERRNIDNLILLCENCNKLVDNKENVEQYPVELLHKWKKNHENFVASDLYNIYWKNLNQKLAKFEIRKQNILIDKTKCYTSSIEIIDNTNEKSFLNGINTISEYINTLIKEKEWNDFPDIFIEGIGGIGKSTELKIAYNNLLDIFQDTNNYDNYQFCPVPYFFELKDFQVNFFKHANDLDNIILFLDGLDEMSNSNIMEFQKYINNLKNQFPNIRFIISGRNAAFSVIQKTTFNKLITIKLSHYFSEDEDAKFIQKYKGTKILDVIHIPFYRELLETEDVTGYKDFFTKLLTKALIKDKERFEYANNITRRDKSIDLEQIQNKLSTFCHNIFTHNSIIFSEDELRKIVKDDFNNLINSSLLSFKDENNISFSSNIIFEYFLARYYSTSTVSVIKRELFLSSGRLNIKYINVIGILLVLLDKNSNLYNYLTQRLAKDTNAFIVLTDFTILNDEERWNYYIKIYNEYNFKKEIIFYLNHTHTHGILSNTESLAESLYNLLPESKKTDAINLLCDNIEAFINNPIETDIYTFANTVILLGIWNVKLWKNEQQERLKEISLPLIKFFLFNSLSTKHLRGLLSERVCYNWYYIYNWTNTWTEQDWYNFINSIYPKTTLLDSIIDEHDCKIKVELFIQFYKNPLISKLSIPLSIYILKNEENDLEKAGFVPKEIDDNYKFPTSHLSDEIFEFNILVKEINDITSDELVYIVYNVLQPSSHFNYNNYESKELFNELINKWKCKKNILSEESCAKLLEIINLFIDNNVKVFISDFYTNLDYIDDNSKINILTKLESARIDTAKQYYVYIIISKLLNISDKEKAETILSQITKAFSDETFKNVISTIHSQKDHVLYDTVTPLFQEFFSVEIAKEEKRQEKLKKLETSVTNMFNNENCIIQSKELLLNEINKIYDYIITNKAVIERHGIFELTVDGIKNRLLWDYDDYEQPPIFSDFIIKLIICCYTATENYENAILKAKEIVINSFETQTKFWKFFFWHYICEYTSEKIFDCLEKNPSLKTQIIKSLEIDVKNSIQTLTVHNAEAGVPILKNWLTPFILSLKYLYNENIPDWFEKNKLSIFTVYPSWHLKVTPGVLDETFAWLEYKSVFEWLINSAKLDKTELIEQSIKYFVNLHHPESKAQILTYLINNINELQQYKTKLYKFIISETIIEINEDYSSKQSNVLNWRVLSDFWNKCEENLIEYLIERIPFEKYNTNTRNNCLNIVINYFIRIATKEQKVYVIKKYKNRININNIEELLASLGYEKAILRIINNYRHGKNISPDLYFSRKNNFTQYQKSNSILFAYIRLLNYSLKDNTPRRNSLYTISQLGIKMNITKKTFPIVRYTILRIVHKRRKELKYVEGLLDFLDELEQIIFH